MVVGAYQCFEDHYIGKEDNEAIASVCFFLGITFTFVFSQVLLQYLFDPNFKLFKADITDPDIRVNTTLPNTLELAKNMKGVIKDTDRAPVNYTSLFSSDLFKFDRPSHSPSFLQSSKSLFLLSNWRFIHHSLETSKNRISNCSIWNRNSPLNVKASLNSRTNVCVVLIYLSIYLLLLLFFFLFPFFPLLLLPYLSPSGTNSDEDLESYILQAADIVGLTTILPEPQSSTPGAKPKKPQKPDARKIIEYMFRNILQFKCEDSSTPLPLPSRPP